MRVFSQKESGKHSIDPSPDFRSGIAVMNPVERKFSTNHYDIMNIGSMKRSLNPRLVLHSKLTVQHGPVIRLEVASYQGFEDIFDKYSYGSTAGTHNAVLHGNVSRTTQRLFSFLIEFPTTDPSQCRSGEVLQDFKLELVQFKVILQSSPRSDQANISMSSHKNIGVQAECGFPPASPRALSTQLCFVASWEGASGDDCHEAESIERLDEVGVGRLRDSPGNQTEAGTAKQRVSREPASADVFQEGQKSILLHGASGQDNFLGEETTEEPVETTVHQLTEPHDYNAETGSASNVEFTEAVLISDVIEREANDPTDSVYGENESSESADTVDYQFTPSRVKQSSIPSPTEHDMLEVNRNDHYPRQDTWPEPIMFVVRKKANGLWDNT